MFIGINLLCSKVDYKSLCSQIGVSSEKIENQLKELHKELSQPVRKNLDQFILNQTSGLDGTKLQNTSFPTIDADIFISHSHDDLPLATLIAYNFKEMGLKPFIDSYVWDYADDLLKVIDNEYCLNPSGDTYSYTKRNYSTSHIHMMLSTALTEMIDQCECLLFLNTPNSIPEVQRVIEKKTKSPWLYFELCVSKTIQQNTPLRFLRTHHEKAMQKRAALEGALDESLVVHYSAPLDHLYYLNAKDLIKIFDSNLTNTKILDELYRLSGAFI